MDIKGFFRKVGIKVTNFNRRKSLYMAHEALLKFLMHLILQVGLCQQFSIEPMLVVGNQLVYLCT